MTSEQKKVQFQTTIVVHKLIVWDFASRDSRKGRWMQRSIDRERFQRKIKLYHEPILQIVTDENHRQKIYKDRFSSFNVASDRVEMSWARKNKTFFGCGPMRILHFSHQNEICFCNARNQISHTVNLTSSRVWTKNNCMVLNSIRRFPIWKKLHQFSTMITKFWIAEQPLFSAKFG